MDAQVTEDMVSAAQRHLPGIWNRERIRRSIAAALDTMPDPEPAQPVIEHHTPELNPALERPLELGSLAEAARRLGVARSTVTGWVKNRATNHMPDPVHGDVYDLRALAAWHTAWKGNA